MITTQAGARLLKTLEMLQDRPRSGQPADDVIGDPHDSIVGAAAETRLAPEDKETDGTHEERPGRLRCSSRRLLQGRR